MNSKLKSVFGCLASFAIGDGTATYYYPADSGEGGSSGGGGTGGMPGAPWDDGTNPIGTNCSDVGYDPADLSATAPWDPVAFANDLRSHALPGSSGHCATFVRSALCRSNGIACNGGPNALDYGPFLVTLGFGMVTEGSGIDMPDGYSPQRGDIAVFSYLPYGHVCAWDGQNWISDFVQLSIQPNIANPIHTFVIYRKE